MAFPLGKQMHYITQPMVVRMRELRGLDVSYPAIARIVSHDWDWPVVIREETVRNHCKGLPKKPRGRPLA